MKIDTNLSRKEKKLKTILFQLKKFAIAFSGGFDSSFLAKFAEKTIGKDNVLLVHIESVFSPSRDKRAVAKFAKENQLKILKIKANPLSNKNVVNNSKDRCYYCKIDIMKMIINRARENNFLNIADGTNYDDIFEERPGFKACNELKILHPLLDSKITKKDMMKLSKKYRFNLKYCPSSACLATRVPVGTKIKLKYLKMVDSAEDFLYHTGIISPRVRLYEENAVIEVPQNDFKKILKNKDKIIEKFHQIGFKKVLMDLNGYRKITKIKN